LGRQLSGNKRKVSGFLHQLLFIRDCSRNLRVVGGYNQEIQPFG